MKSSRALLLSALLLLFGVNLAICQPIPNPVGFWAAEGNALDSAGPNHGSINSSFSFVPGIDGQAFSFAGGTVSVPNATNLNLATNITVQFWVKGSTPSPFQYLVAKNGGNAGASYAFYTGGDSSLYFWINVPADTGYFGLIISPAANGAAVWDGAWHQVTGVYDGVAVHLYVDGVEAGSGTPTTTSPPSNEISYLNAGALVLGNFSVGGGSAWAGALDNFKVFSRALVGVEVVDTFTNSSSTFATNGLVSWLRCDGNTLDSWGSNNGVVNASTISFFAGKAGLGFLSAGGSILVSNAPALEPQNITVQAWVKSTAPGSFKYVLSKCRVPTWGSYALYTAGNGGMAFLVSVGSSGSGALTLSPLAEPGIIWDGAWHQVIGTFDGATVRLYVDGLEVGSGTPASGSIDYASSPALHNGALVIANDPTLGFGMSGGIDEVKIWNQALTSQQVLDNYKASGLISWWRAETNANDSVGTNNGTLQGSVAYGPSRLSGKAFKFSGGVVSIPDSASLRPGNLTIEASVNGLLPGTNKYLLSKGFSSTSPSYALHTGPNGGLVFSVTLNTGIVSSTAADASVIWDGQYHAVAGTFDGASVRLFVDGKEIGSGSSGVGAIQYAATFNNGKLLVGDFYDTLSSSNFIGSIDDVKIYSAALTLQQIRADKYEPAIITSQPVSLTVASGSTASFSVSALPSGLTYQWMHDGTNLTGRTQSTLTLTNVSAAQSGSYQVAVTAGGGVFITNSLLGGQAFHLPGAVIDIAQATNLEPASQVTVQVWVRRASSPNAFSYMLTKSFSGGVGSFALYTPGSGGAAFYVWLTGNALVVSPDAGTAIWDGNWHQLTGVYDGAFVRLYVDGQQVGSGTDTFGGGTIEYISGRTTDGDLIIGDFAGLPGGSNFGGDIDEVKIFNAGMSDSDVLSTFTTPSSPASTNGLISLWSGNGNALDSIGSNHGRILPPFGTIISDIATLTLIQAEAIFSNSSVSGGNFQSTLTGPSGQTFAVERTDSLSTPNWTRIVTNSVPFTFTNSINGSPSRYYRAVSVP